MAVPSTAITRFDLASTMSEFNLAMNQAGFIAPRILRPALVGMQSADVGKIPLKALLETADDDRAPGGAYRRSDFKFEKYDYSTEEHGHEEPMDDRTLKVYGDIISAEEVHAQRAINIVAQNYEIAVAAAIQNTTTFNGADLTTGVTNEWNDWDNATPIADVLAAKRKIVDATGYDPNVLQINRRQLDSLINCDEVIDRVKYAGFDDPKNVTLQALAALFSVEEIVVAGLAGAGIKNTANPGQSASLSRIWSDEYASLLRVARTDDLREPCIGRTFIFSEDGVSTPGSADRLAVIVEEYREEAVRGSVIRARADYGLKIMYVAMAHLLSNIIDTTIAV